MLSYQELKILAAKRGFTVTFSTRMQQKIRHFRNGNV